MQSRRVSGRGVAGAPKVATGNRHCRGSVASPALEDVEGKHILGVLAKTWWRLTGKGGATEQFGLKRTTLHSRMKKLGIRRPAS